MKKHIFIGLSLAVMAALPAWAVTLHGTLAQGGMAWGQVTPGSKVVLDGNPVMVGPKGNFVIGFGRDAAHVSHLVVMGPDGKKQTKTLKIRKRKFSVERVNGLPPKTVTMPPEWLARRKVETGRVVKARMVFTDALDWLHGFTIPAHGRFSGFYGSQRILNGKPRSPHYGLDIAAPVGTPIVAPESGVVRLADPAFLLEGGIVIIDHGFGVSSTMFHMNTVEVKEGQHVKRGERIGTIGMTGRATGPHVDWRINIGALRLDPELLLKDKNGKVTTR
ncbi:M23 family metallopeptidase [Kordiimonas marina]|uniref:M23 family metallopeptidase n=1 Tax=Kordiimonas marina TaxID=2872312 RepID=UPI001FF63255|nr:M23 family metallopeptidase [Kordiimonas marina]MCJ9427818.1 M23 family metallopeptidase [Kordiimonas marina]